MRGWVERVRRSSRAAGATPGEAGGADLSILDVDAPRTLGDVAPALLGEHSSAMSNDDAVRSTPNMRGCSFLAIPSDGDLAILNADAQTVPDDERIR